jgi:transaldolase/glucose-6-phosphate isomerase
MASPAETKLDAAVARLEQTGQPVVRLELEGPYDLGREFFRWELATAVAGAILGINPFDQPDVEEAKEAARKLTEAYEKSGDLPVERPIAEDGPLTFFADEANASELRRLAANGRSAGSLLRAHLGRLQAGDYFALLAYLDSGEANTSSLQAIRHRVRDAYRVATCLGFGPRFQHSTGQVYKGGPNTGVFLQLTRDHPEDLPVPGRRLTFGVVEAAQARGDMQALLERGRRALRVHLGGEEQAGLERLRELLEKALL